MGVCSWLTKTNAYIYKKTYKNKCDKVLRLYSHSASDELPCSSSLSCIPHYINSYTKASYKKRVFVNLYQQLTYMWLLYVLCSALTFSIMWVNGLSYASGLLIWLQCARTRVRITPQVVAFYHDSHCNIQPQVWAANLYCSAQVDSAFHPPWNGKMSISLWAE